MVDVVRVVGGAVRAVRLDRIRGPVPPRHHNARTIAALTGNPGCDRRAVLDAAGVDKLELARHVGFPARFGQSPFAIARGNAFEAQVKADGCAVLLDLLRELLGAPDGPVDYDDLSGPAGADDLTSRNLRALRALTEAAGADGADGAERAGTILDHPLLSLDVAGQRVYLEPDLLALRIRGRYHVVEIKSFAVIDGQADPAKVAAAATQAAVYVLALRQALTDAGFDPGAVSPEAVLVCPENFANRPVAALIDVRRQLTVIRRQLARMTRIETLLARLPDDLTFDLGLDPAGTATREPAEVSAALGAVAARYAPTCLATCELAAFCRNEAAGSTVALGRGVREELGGVEEIGAVLGLATGVLTPGADQAEAAALLRAAGRLRAEALA